MQTQAAVAKSALSIHRTGQSGRTALLLKAGYLPMAGRCIVSQLKLWVATILLLSASTALALPFQASSPSAVEQEYPADPPAGAAQCEVLIRGAADGSVEAASVTCTGASAVPLAVGPLFRQFSSKFSGVKLIKMEDVDIGSKGLVFTAGQMPLVLRKSSVQGVHNSPDANSALLSFYKCSSAWVHSSWFRSNVSPMAAGNRTVAGPVLGAYDTNLTVVHTAFEDNRGLYKGGALHVLRYNADPSTALPMHVRVLGSNFTDNSAGWLAHMANDDGRLVEAEGGAIHARHISSLAVLKSKFERNFAGQSGGGITLFSDDSYSSTSTLLVDSCGFTKNTAANALNLEHEPLSDSYDRVFRKWWGGGAICVWGASLQVTNSKFHGNSAGEWGQGGAVLHVTKTGTSNFSGSAFEGNTAHDGGAIQETCNTSDSRPEGSGCELKATIDECRFSHNTAIAQGGAVNIICPLQAHMLRSNFTLNQALNDSVASLLTYKNGTMYTTFYVQGESQGGALYIAGNVKENDPAATSIEHCHFTKNHAGTGGAVLLKFNSYVNTGTMINWSVFTNNSAAKSGGAVSNQQVFLALVQNSQFAGNTAQKGGAVHNYYGMRHMFYNNKFTNNQAAMFGGGYYCDVCSRSQFADTSFNGNTAATAGGAVFIADNNECGLFLRCSFLKNSASYAGAVYSTNHDIILNTCSKDEWWPTAFEILTTDPLIPKPMRTDPDLEGEATLLSDNSFFMLDTEFVDNTALLDGGAFIIDGITRMNTFLYNVTARHNTAVKGRGGFAFLTQSRKSCPTCFIRIANCTISLNSAGLDGGAIAYLASQSAAILSFIRTDLIGNTAGWNGGAVFASRQAAVWFTKHTRVLDNKATGRSGGGLHCDSCQSVVIRHHVLIDSNSAAEAGGGLYCKDCVELLAMNDARLLHNAAMSGAAMEIDSVTISTFTILSNTAVKNNTAGNTSRDWLVRNNSGATYDSLPGSGGGVRALGGKLALIDCNFHGNRASVLLGNALFAANRTLPLPLPANSSTARHVNSAGTATYKALFGKYVMPNYESYGGLYESSRATADNTSMLAESVLLSDKAQIRRLTVPGWEAARKLPGSLVILTDATWQSLSDGNETGFQMFAESMASVQLCNNSAAAASTSLIAMLGEAAAINITIISAVDQKSMSGSGPHNNLSAVEPVICKPFSPDSNPNSSASQQPSSVPIEHLAAGPAEIRINGSQAPQFVVKKHRSGGQLSLQLQLFDAAGRLMRDMMVPNSLVRATVVDSVNPTQGPNATAPQRSVEQQPTVLLIGTVTALMSGGTASITDLRIQGPPNSTASVRFEMAAYPQVTPPELRIEFRPCLPGEELDGSECSMCGINTYSTCPPSAAHNSNEFNSSSTLNATSSSNTASGALESCTGHCNQCPLHATCLGGAVLIPEPGYWHTSATSPDMIPCPNPKACRMQDPHAQKALSDCSLSWYNATYTVAALLQPKDYDAGNNSLNLTCILPKDAPPHPTPLPSYNSLQCSKGYTGNICGRCTQTPTSRYGQTSPFSCTSCPRYKALSVLLMAAFILAKAGLYGYTTHSTLTQNLRQATERPEAWHMALADWLVLLALFYQLNSIILQVGGSTNAPNSWPGAFRLIMSAMSSAFSTAAMQAVAPLQCILEAISPAAPTYIITKALLTLLDVALALAVAAWLRWRAHRQASTGASPAPATCTEASPYDPSPAAAATGLVPPSSVAVQMSTQINASSCADTSADGVTDVQATITPSPVPAAANTSSSSTVFTPLRNPNQPLSDQTPHAEDNLPRSRTSPAALQLSMPTPAARPSPRCHSLSWLTVAAHKASRAKLAAASKETCSPRLALPLSTSTHGSTEPAHPTDMMQPNPDEYPQSVVDLAGPRWLRICFIIYSINLFPTTANSLLSVFNCMRLGQAPAQYWALDPNSVCYSGLHGRLVLPVMGLPLLLVSGVVLFGSLVLLWRPASTLHTTNRVQQYGFLFKPFRNKRWCTSWRASQMVAILLINTVVGPGRLLLSPLYQLYLINAMIIVILALSLVVRPFSRPFAQLEKYTWWMWGVLAGVCTFLSAQLSAANGFNNNGLGLMTVLVMVVYGMFAVGLARRVHEHAREQFEWMDKAYLTVVRSVRALQLPASGRRRAENGGVANC